MIKILACGVNKYEGSGGNLSFCVNDAKEFCKAFDANIIVDEINNFSETGEVRKEQYKNTLKKYCMNGSNNDILIYFHSGHGEVDKYNNSYLQLTDDRIYIDEIVKILNASKAKSKIIILDACHCDIGAEYMPPVDKDNSDNFCGKGIAIFSSCKKSECSMGSEEIGISVFTNFLCDAVSDNWLTKGKFLYFNDLQTLVSIYAQNYNRQNPEQQQTPVMRTSLIGTVAFPTRRYKENPKENKQRLQTQEFDVLDIIGSIKVGNNGGRRKFVRASIVLKFEMEQQDIEKIIEKIVIYLQKNREKISARKWKEIREESIEIMYLLIYKGSLDKELDIYSYVGRWTLNKEDNNWHEKDKVRCTDRGYVSWKYNENYNYIKENKIKNVFVDKELLIFWKKRIRIISEEIAEFDQKYREYISEDIICNDLRECAISACVKLIKIVEECDNSCFPMPFSKCKRFHELGLKVATNARSIPQVFLLCEEGQLEFRERIDLKWSQYYESLAEWGEEKEVISSYLEEEKSSFIQNIIQKIKHRNNLSFRRP